jgi:hypothetical protein
MTEVATFKDTDVYERILGGEMTPSFRTSVKYYQASIGASTEEPQRRARLEAIAELVYANEGV